MTTPTSMGNHGGTVTSCSPYAYPGFAEICILLRTWSTVAPGTYELAFLIQKKKKRRLVHGMVGDKLTCSGCAHAPHPAKGPTTQGALAGPECLCCRLALGAVRWVSGATAFKLQWSLTFHEVQHPPPPLSFGTMHTTEWEIPLQPLPKRHKTHWDPCEWGI